MLSPDPLVRICVGGHAHTPAGVLTLLATDRYWPVRRSVAHNHNTPVHLLDQLANDIHPDVVHTACAHHAMPIPLPSVNRLHPNTSAPVRLAAAAHPGTPVEVLDALAATIAAPPNYPEALPGTCAALTIHLLHNPNTAADTLERMYTLTADPDLHHLFIEHPHASTALLRQLASHTDPMTATHAHRVGRVRSLRRYADTFTAAERTQAHLLIDAGFAGWPDDLGHLLANQRTITTVYGTPSQQPITADGASVGRHTLFQLTQQPHISRESSAYTYARTGACDACMCGPQPQHAQYIPQSPGYRERTASRHEPCQHHR